MKFKALRIHFRNWLLLLSVGMAVCLPAFSDSESAGEVLFVSGLALSFKNETQFTLSKGDKITVGDLLKTGPDGYLHVRFNDGGLISLRPGSEARIHQYHVDNASPAENRVELELLEGVMRSSTGDAGKANKNAYRINTPVAAIGIRGTDFVVLADDSIVRVAVNEGGVVMAPFSDSCQREALTPCSGDSSAELFAKAERLFLETREGTDHAIVTGDGASPDEISPPHPEEAETFDSVLTAIRSSLFNNRGLSAPGAESYEEGIENVGRYLGEETLAQEAFLLGNLESSSIIPNNRNLIENPEIVWGRWSHHANASPNYVSIARLLYDNRQYAITGTNAFVFALLEGLNPQRVVPESGTATFKLDAYESYIKRGSALEVAGISNPALIIDFDDSRFATRLDIHADSLPGVVHVLGAGDVTEQGFLYSDAQSLTAIDGVLNANALEAGYLFDYQISSGVNAVGATHWLNNKQLR